MSSINETSEKLKEVLASIGMNKNAAEIYLDLLRHQTSSALEISKRTGIHRSNTYDALRELIEQGFISEVIEEKRKLFKAGSPEKIKDYLEQKQKEVNDLVPELKEISSEDNKKKEVSVSQGIFAIREALNEMLQEKKEIMVFGASETAYQSIGVPFLNEFHKERIKNQIKMRHIYDKNAVERIKKLNKMKFTEARCVSHQYFSVVSTNICNNSVYIFIFGKPQFAIRIKNESVAESYRNYFELLWNESNKC